MFWNSPSSSIEVISTTYFKRDVLTYLLFLLGLTAIDIILALTLEPSAERAGLQPPVRIAIPIMEAFFITTLASLAVGKWTTSAVISRIRAQIKNQGFLTDNRSCIFSDFGFNLFFGGVIGLAMVGQRLCEGFFILPSRSPVMKTLHCYLFTGMSRAVLSGLGVGFLLWIYFAVIRIEAETNSKIMLQRYSTRNWSIVMIAVGAAVTYVIIYAFYKIFTLGQE